MKLQNTHPWLDGKWFAVVGRLGAIGIGRSVSLVLIASLLAIAAAVPSIALRPASATSTAATSTVSATRSASPALPTFPLLHHILSFAVRRVTLTRFLRWARIGIAFSAGCIVHAV
jgi:hypothetical protein